MYNYVKWILSLSWHGYGRELKKQEYNQYKWYIYVAFLAPRINLIYLDFLQMSAVSALSNQPIMQNFLFRNYNYGLGTYSHYPGSVQHHFWQAIRASSAAPGYYEEFKVADGVHTVCTTILIIYEINDIITHVLIKYF